MTSTSSDSGSVSAPRLDRMIVPTIISAPVTTNDTTTPATA